jgi:hypothetical protein
MQPQIQRATSLWTIFFVACAAATAACSTSTSDKQNDKLSRSDASPEAADTGPAPVPPPEPDDCFMTGDAGFKTHHCEGLDFEISVPDECLSHACGIITDIHGFGMNAALMEGHTHMQELGNAKGYIVMQPSAPAPARSWSPSNDAQVWAIIQRAIHVWHVDPKRIHVDGYSMGAWMTWRLLCAHSDVLASVAPIAGGLQPMGSCPFGPDGTGAPNEPATPMQQVPVLYTHGRNDGLVNFSQAMAERDAVVAAWYPGVEPAVVMKDFDYEWDRYTNSNGNVFEFIQHDWECGFVLAIGGNNVALKGHCFPGSPAFLGCGRDTNGMLDGGVVYPFEWAKTVLQFFVDHPKKNY